MSARANAAAGDPGQPGRQRDERSREEAAGRHAGATKSRSGPGLPPSASEWGETGPESGGLEQ
jgi:hypothetical protein